MSTWRIIQNALSKGDLATDPIEKLINAAFDIGCSFGKKEVYRYTLGSESIEYQIEQKCYNNKIEKFKKEEKII